MKLRILLLFVFCTLICCKREQKISSNDWNIISKRLQYKDEASGLHIKSGNYTYDFKANQVPFKKVILLNASLMGYVSALHAEDLVIGVSSP